MNYVIVWFGIALLILVHEFGHWIVARLCGLRTPVFSIGIGKPVLCRAKFWDTEFRLTPWLVAGYVEIPELADESTLKDYLQSRGEDPTAIKYIPIWKRALVASAGVAMNILTALLVLFLLFAFIGKPNPQVTDVYVSQLATGITIASDAGVKPNDVIVAVDGQPIKTGEDVVKGIQAHKGSPARLTLKRGGQTVELLVTPDADGHIGILIGQHQTMKFDKVRARVAAAGSVKLVASMSTEMAQRIGMMLHIIPTPKNDPAGANDVHGVIGIAQFGSGMLEYGLFGFGMFLAMVSVNLAIVNILPLPMLDGGYLLFFAYEAIAGKPLHQGVRNALLVIFFYFIIGVFLLGLFNDIFHPIFK